MIFERIDSLDCARFSRSLDFADAVEIADEVRSGYSKIYRVEDGFVLAHVVLRQEGSELVVVAFEGRELRRVSSEIVRRATLMGFRTIRFHTRRPAVARIISHLRPRLREYVYEVSTDGRKVTQ